MLSQRIGCAKSLLSRHADWGDHEHVSKLQRDAILSLLDRITLDPEHKADVAAEMSGIQWYGNHGNDILQKMAEEQVIKHKRRAQQDYRAFLSFLTLLVWNWLLDDETSSEAKLGIIITALLQLGLRCPREPTYKLMTSFWIVLCEKKDTRAKMSSGTKKSLLQKVKERFDDMRKNAPDPATHLKSLPDTPEELQARARPLYNAAYKDERPVPCRIDWKEVLEFDASYKCRGETGGDKAVPVIDLQSSGSVGPIPGGMGEAVNVVFKSLEMMSRQQQQMMSMMMASQGGKGSLGRQALQTSVNRTRRLPTLDCGPGGDLVADTDARPCPIQELPEDMESSQLALVGPPLRHWPQPQGARADFSGASDQQPAGLAMQAAEPPTDVLEKPEHVRPKVEDMLDLLTERENEKKAAEAAKKKAKKQEEKAAAKAQAAAEGKGKGADGGAEPKKKGSGKGAALAAYWKDKTAAGKGEGKPAGLLAYWKKKKGKGEKGKGGVQPPLKKKTKK